MATGCGWDDVLSEELHASHTFEDEVLSCEAARTPSTCAEDERDDSPKNLPSVWWAVLLKSAGIHLGMESEGTSTSQAPPVQIVSGCTGCGAEAFVMKARGGAGLGLFGRVWRVWLRLPLWCGLRLGLGSRVARG